MVRIFHTTWLFKTGLWLTAGAFCLSAPAVPAPRLLPLFVIERSQNANVVHYDAKLRADGTLDPQQPVVAYWVMAAENGRRQDLNLLERARAYGFSTQALDMDAYMMTIVSEKKHQFVITHQGETARAETQLGACHAYLQRIYVTTRKSLLLNLPESAEMYGADVATGRPCYEKVTP